MFVTIVSIKKKIPSGEIAFAPKPEKQLAFL
jgi:hypothetical protein